MADVAASETCDLLLTGGSVVTVDDDRRVFEPGAVAIAGDRIIAVGPASELAGIGASRSIDCSGCAVIPGFTDCHDHLTGTLLRGLEGAESMGAGGSGVQRWVAGGRGGVTRDEAVAAARLGALEAILSGTTAVVHLHEGPGLMDLDSVLAVADALHEVGLRGVVARRMIGDVSGLARELIVNAGMTSYTRRDEIRILRDAVSVRRGSRVEVWPAPPLHGSLDLARAASNLARTEGVRWHAHRCGLAADADTTRSHRTPGLVEQLDEAGLLGTETTLANALDVDDHEVARLAQARTGVVYAPISDQACGADVLPLRALLDAGAIVGLGTGESGGGRRDPFELMKQAILLQRVDTLDPTISVAEEALELATMEGARFLGTDAGTLAPGRLADVAVVRLGRAHTTPWHRTVATLVYSARPSDVEITIVGGEVVVEGGRSTRVDESSVIADAHRAAEAVVSRWGLDALRVPWRR